MSQSPTPHPLRRRFRIFLAVVVVYVALFALVPFGYDRPFLAALAVGAVIGVSALVVSQFLAIVRKPCTNEEEFEAEYNSRQQLKSTMVEIAEQVYPQSPVGTWHYRDVSYPQRGFPKVHEEKTLELTADGRGTYRLIDHDLDVKCQTTFQFQPGDKGSILVRLTAPPSDDWTPVTFGFDMENNAGGQEQLVLWMEGDCPLPDDLLMHWPFNERFVRAD
jgi:hypothetical protein